MEINLKKGNKNKMDFIREKREVKRD